MADNQIVKIDFQFDLGNVPASSKAFANYLKGLGVDLKFTKASTDALAASVSHLATAQTKAAAVGALAANSVKKSNQQWTNFALVIQDLPYGFRGIQNNLPALLGGVAGLAGPIYFVGSAIIALFTAWDAGLFKVKDATNALKDAQKEYNDTLKSSMGTAGEEIAKMNALVSIAGNHEITMSKRLSAVKKLQDEYPSYFGNLDKEKILNGDVATATDGVKTAIIERAKATAVASKINKLAAEKFAKDEELYQLALQKTARVQAAVNFVKQFPTSAKHLKGLIDASVGGIRDQENAIKSFVDSIDKELNRLQGIYTTTETGSIDLENNKGGKKGKTPEELAKEKARLAEVANNAETQAFIDTLNERAQKEYKAGLELAIGLEKMKAAGYSNSETYYASYRANMDRIAKEYDDKEYKRNQDSINANIAFETKIRKDSERAYDAIQKKKTDSQVKYTKDRVDSLNLELKTELKLHRNSITLMQEDINMKIKQLELLKVFAFSNAESIKIINKAINNQKALLKGYGERWDSTSQQIKGIIEGVLTDVITQFATNIGQALAGEKVDIFGGIGEMIAEGAIAIGKALIAYGVALTAFKLAKLNPGLAIVAGAGLVIAGSFLKSKLSSKDKTAGATPFASGGIVSGPTMGLIGEYPGAKSNPEVVAPLDKLKSMIGGGGGGQFLLRGQDLLLAVNRAQKASNLKGQTISLA